MAPEEILELAKRTPVDSLPRLVGVLAEAQAVAYTRLLAPAPALKTESIQLVDRREAARILGVSIYFLEGKSLPCQQRAGRKILYNKATLESYVRRGHVPYQDRSREVGLVSYK